MRLSAAFFALSILVASGSVQAADGSSGCGPGWYILKQNSMVSSIGRAITNGVLFPVSTLGMTLGTSNCAKHSLVEAHQRSLHFATRSYDILRQDMARGHGRHLDAYLATFGCDALGRNNLAGQMQAAFEKELYLTIQPDALVESTARMIQTSPALQSSCS
ncbi:DUF3015 family protein [Oligoflexus tunisiensis]|uniref:DUF3015 family protein n=1 Tax=Oligoflexus tunisiensis TaxID=708132 RepID=UPI00114CC944|nr:DUF3015 family protein [Oligoflexus tunisiensis]